MKNYVLMKGNIETEEKFRFKKPKALLEKERVRHEENKKIKEYMEKQGKDILDSFNFKETKKHIQHGKITVHDHSVSVARCSISISDGLEKFGIECNKKALIRGALLHDYFLYDWHDPEHLEITNLHGFYHPGIALKNAKQEYNLTRREQEIIKKHMWPLTIVPPLCREAWIVTAADKICSLKETLKRR